MTTTDLIRHATVRPAIPAPDREPTHCKYVVVEAADGEILPILFHHKLQHRDAVPEGLRPVSAGYVMIYQDCLCIPEIDSTTLNLGPRAEDKALISALLNQ